MAFEPLVRICSVSRDPGGEEDGGLVDWGGGVALLAEGM